MITRYINKTPEFGLVSISILCNEDSIEVNFKDSGLGIPANEREHVLERFVRLDTLRNAPGNGSG